MRSIVLLLSSFVISASVFATDANGSYVPGEFVVKIKKSTKGVEALSSALKLKPILKNEGIYLVQRPTIEAQDYSLHLLSSYSDIEVIEPNYIYHLQKKPNDVYFDLQWGLYNYGQRPNSWDGVPGVDINALKAWDITIGSKDIVIAVTDTGLKMDIDEMQSNLWVNVRERDGVTGVDDDQNGFIDDINGYDFANDRGSITDVEGHGSHVTTTIGAQSNDARGVCGVVWNTSIMTLKIFGGESAVLSNAILAIDYAIQNKARVINASWGGTFSSQLLKDAIERANKAGVVFVAAAGNEFSNNDLPENEFYPANYEVDNVISVAAVDNQGDKASFSNYGKVKVHVAAPGVDVYAFMGAFCDEVECHPPGYRFLSGTSMAAPHVTGAVALLLSINPNLSAKQVRDILVRTSKKLPKMKDRVASGGIIDVFAAIQEAQLLL